MRNDELEGVKGEKMGKGKFGRSGGRMGERESRKKISKRKKKGGKKERTHPKVVLR